MPIQHAQQQRTILFSEFLSFADRVSGRLLLLESMSRARVPTLSLHVHCLYTYLSGKQPVHGDIRTDNPQTRVDRGVQ